MDIADPLDGISVGQATTLESAMFADELNRLLLESAADGIYAVDANGLTTFINSAAAKMTGWAPDELVGKPHQAFIHYLSQGGGTAPPLSPIPGPRCGEDAVFLRKDGSSFPAAYTCTSVVRQEELFGSIVVFRDNSEKKDREKLEQSRSEVLSAVVGRRPLSAILQMIADLFLALCPSKAIAILLLSGLECHIEAEAGLPKRQSRADKAPAAQFGSERENADWAAFGCPGLRQILDSGRKLCLLSPLNSASGEAIGAFAIFDHQQGLLDDSSRRIIQSLSDLTRVAVEYRRLYDEVIHRSQYDSLTGLPNRSLLEDRLRQAMVVARRQGTLVAVCCIGLDRFKQINDSLGHDLGDAFFKLVSERMHLSIRDIDTLARHCGDEFILALSDIAETADADRICHRLLKDLSAPYLLEGHSLTISASIGISIFPNHGDASDLLLRNADMALRAAKQAGGGKAQMYSPAVGRQTRRAAEMVDALQSAIAHGEFYMAYQPIYNLQTEIVAFEALLRWKHPDWGQVSPLQFISTAEKSGLIVPIGDFVIDEVCRQAMEWNAAAVQPVKMFANVSGVQLERSNFSSKIADALARTGLPPHRLELEITESWIISDLRGAAGKLQKLRDLGIGIAIDDFGTGYSTFNYLQELPLDTLKIDRSFIHRLDGSAANLSTVRAITMLAQELRLKTVAEGVESEQQIQQLAEIGCEFIQGFFLARPLKPHAACSLLRKQQRSRPFVRSAADESPTVCLTR